MILVVHADGGDKRPELNRTCDNFKSQLTFDILQTIKKIF